MELKDTVATPVVLVDGPPGPPPSPIPVDATIVAPLPVPVNEQNLPLPVNEQNLPLPVYLSAPIPVPVDVQGKALFHAGQKTVTLVATPEVIGVGPIASGSITVRALSTNQGS